MSIRIATYNINGINQRLDNLLRWLKSTSPDIVCLQELKSERFPRAELEQAGYGAVWNAQKAWNGVAILARGAEPVLIREGLPNDPEPEQKRYIEAAVSGIFVASLYCPNGNPAPGEKYDYKLRWMKALRKRALEVLKTGAPAVLAGDYNVIPEDADVYRPEAWRKDALFRPEVRKAYALLLKDGWVDTIRHLHPDERIYTFWKYWRYSFERDAGLRIDHVLASPAISPRVTEAGVDKAPRGWESKSDHAPAWITLADGPAA